MSANKVYSISGYWKDDKTEMGGLVCSSDCIPEEMDDEDIFFYDMDEDAIIDAIEKGEDTVLDFVITEYEEG